MSPKECKRLAKAGLPVADISRHSAREKSIRHRHPATLRRPLSGPARLEWQEGNNVAHYDLSVDAIARRMSVRKEGQEYGGPTQ